MRLSSSLATLANCKASKGILSLEARIWTRSIYFTRQIGRKGVISRNATVYSRTERKTASQQGPLHLTDATSTYTWFYENRATKTCQCLALIGNLMPLFTGKVKSHRKKKF